MPQERDLEQIVHQLEDMLGAAIDDPRLSGNDLRRVLAFLTKVVQVVDQAFQDVFAVLIDFKYLSADDIASGRFMEMRKNLDLLLARSRYRDAEEICSRLHHLRTQYETQIHPLVDRLQGNDRWRQVFWLIEEREGRIIMLVNQTVYELARLFDTAHADIDEIRQVAGGMADKIRLLLIELRNLTNEIMGFSDHAGFMELTEDRDALARQARTLLIHNRGTLHMSRDTYSAGQAGAMGPGAHAHDMTFQQVWNQSKGDIDLQKLAGDLSDLRSAMKAKATTPEDDAAVGAVAAAETAAKGGDGPKALAHLKSAGKWAFDIATKVGTTVAAAALKTALGL